MSLREKVKEMLHGLHGSPIWNVNDATEAILEVIEEVIPEESKSSCVCDRGVCWNECVEEMRRRVRE